MDDNFDVFQTMATTPRKFPHMDLLDVENNRVDVESIASSHHLILITLKNTTCPACPQLLKILNMYGLDPDTNTYSDPFTLQEWEIDQVRKRFFRLLLKFDAYFIILCPGTNQDVRHVQQSTPFLDYPFIAGEQASVLARALKVQLSDQEFMPAMLEVSKGTLSVDPIYIGRGPGLYFHHFLFKRLTEERCKLEMKGIICSRDINELINQLKKKIIKCQDGKMASNSIISPFFSSWTGDNIDKSPLSGRLLSKSPLKRSPPPRPSSSSSSSSSIGAEDNTSLSSPALPLPTTHTTTAASITATATATDAINKEEQSSVDLITNQKADEQQQTKKKQNSLGDLPLELLEIIFSSFYDDISSLVKVSGTCRAFYVATCNVMMLCLRRQMTFLKPALPQQRGNVVWDEAEVADQSLDRWSDNQEGIPFRELERRVSITKDLILNISHWTRRWNPRSRLRSAK